MHASTKLQLSLLTLSVAATGTAWAQEDDGRRVRGIEEVIVTAQRREESSQVVPVSMNAFSPEMITERSVLSLSDLTKVSPGIRFVHQGGGGNMNVVLRGLSRIPIGTAPNAVINYFADVPLNFQGSNIPTYDLANIQVLKGPQGTLFGRNAIGGAVVITPQEPTYELGGYLKGSFGNYRYHDAEGALNVPVIDNKLAVRLAAKSTRRDGYTENMGAGKDTDDINQDAFRASVLWEPIDTLTNTLVFDYFEANEAGSGSILTEALANGVVRGPGPLAGLRNFWDCSNAAVPCAGFNPDRDIDDALTQQRAWGPYKTTSEFNQLLYRKLTGISNRTEWELGPVTLRNIFGYRTTQVKTDLNTDGLSFTPNIITASNRTRTQQYSDELHLFGDAFDDRLDYLVGAFYIKEEPNGKTGFLFPVVSTTAPWVESYETKTNAAVFGQIGYDLSALVDGVKFNAGFRHNKTDTELCTTAGPATNLQTTPMPTIGESGCASSVNGSELETDESANTYNVGLDWKINENLFTYITHRKGYREGGINSPGFTTPASIMLAPYQTYQPETLKDIEIGLKSDFNIGYVPVRFNISAYRGKYENVVTSFNSSAIVPASDPGSPQSSAIGINTGERTLSGFETELVVEPFDGLTLTNTAAYTHQKIEEAPVPPIPGLASPSLDPASPKWSTTLALRWVTPFQPLEGQVVVNADWYYQEAYFVGNGELPGYDVSNLRVEWKDISHSGVDAAFFMRNVFNQEYPYAASATSDSLGIYTLSFAEPRMFGLEVKYSFGL